MPLSLKVLNFLPRYFVNAGERTSDGSEFGNMNFARYFSAEIWQFSVILADSASRLARRLHC